MPSPDIASQMRDLVERMGRARNSTTRTYMPAALLAVCDLAGRGNVRDGIVRVEDYRMAFKRLMLQVQPDREDLWFRPMLHITRHRMWRPLRDGTEVNESPRAISRLANERQAVKVADALRLDSELARALTDGQVRQKVVRMVHDLLRADGEPASTRLAEVHEGGLTSDLPKEVVEAGLQELLEYEHRREDRDAFEDVRQRRLAERVLRPGQSDFRSSILSAYGKRCCMSGADVPRALEAAHIIPFRGEHSNRVQNGLLLRRDLHALFDEGLITVDGGGGMLMHLHPELRQSAYRDFHGRAIDVPSVESHRPDPNALDWHRRKNT